MKFFILLISFYLMLTGYSFALDRPSNEIPMYGGEDKSHIEPNKDFSLSASRLGWDYLERGDFDTAIKRFNQAWMFDHNNVDALWGFGIIMAQRANQLQEEPIKNYKESIHFLNMAYSLDPENLRLLADLAFSNIFLGKELKMNNQDPDVQFTRARELLEKAKSIQPDFPIIYANLSVLEYYKGNYQVAKELLDQAKEFGFTVQPSYEEKLNEKLKRKPGVRS